MKFKDPLEWRDCTWSCGHPGLFIFTIDQSVDMKVNYSDSKKRSEFATELVNRSINQLIIKNIDGIRVKNRCYIAVIGYTSYVKVLCKGWLSDLCESPKRIERIMRKVPDGEGGLIDFEAEVPIWVEPETNGDIVNLSVFFVEVRKYVNNWNRCNRTAPIVINLTAGNYPGNNAYDWELKDCFVCNVLCKPDNEIRDDERSFWETHSSSHLPETIIDAMKMSGYDISSLFLDSSMLYVFLNTPFYFQARAAFTL